MKHVNRKEFLSTKIYVPPLEEQRRIAAILDKADGVRRKRKEAIRLTEELLKSTFLEMFGDPVTNPKGWEIKKLEEVTTKITDGVHSRPNYTEQGVPFISVKDITTGELKFDDCKFISEEDHKKYKKRCNPDLGDILYTKVGATYGRPALVNVKSEFSLYVSVCLIKPQRDLIFPEFLKEALATPALKRQADRSIKGIGVPDLHLNMIKDFIVPVPPIYKQKEFLEIASKIQSSKESLTSCSQESENLFNSLLQRAFRGEL
jgi:type I restriction enzyme S subunit